MADGGSTDRTRERLSIVDVEARVRVLDNPGRTAPAALNVAIAAAKGDIVTRVDGHSYVAPDYLSRIVAVMHETGESVVGGPVLMFADTPFRKALVGALYSKVGVGAVPYRTLKTRAYVESLQTGSFRRAVLDQVGPFDEALAVVEDLDMNTRIRKAGHKLLLDPTIVFYAVGLVKVRILRKHPDIFKWKYVLPSVFVVALAAAVGAAAMGSIVGFAFLAVYAVIIVGFALSRVPQLGAGALRLLQILPTLHVGYGLGFLAGASEKILGRSSRPPGAP